MRRGFVVGGACPWPIDASVCFFLSFQPTYANGTIVARGGVVRRDSPSVIALFSDKMQDNSTHNSSLLCNIWYLCCRSNVMPPFDHKLAFYDTGVNEWKHANNVATKSDVAPI